MAIAVKDRSLYSLNRLAAKSAAISGFQCAEVFRVRFLFHQERRGLECGNRFFELGEAIAKLLLCFSLSEGKHFHVNPRKVPRYNGKDFHRGCQCPRVKRRDICSERPHMIQYRKSGWSPRDFSALIRFKKRHRTV